jgi:hypothetical protein
MALDQIIESAEVLDNCSKVRPAKDVLTRLQRNRTAHFLCRLRRLLAMRASELYSTEAGSILKRRLTTGWLIHGPETAHADSQPFDCTLIFSMPLPHRRQTLIRASFSVK